ncbi:MAG: hypothetical protein OEZ14_14905, partial [Acidimicrobiia bacterium]|nr:hypothetical protein [Acidimicrobiia bacterium]
AAVALFGLVALTFLSGPGDNASSTGSPGDDLSPLTATTAGTTTSTTEPLPTEPMEVGEAWLASIVDGDRDRFVALHDEGFDQANETLMMWGWHSNRPGTFADRYFDGYDAFRAALDVDDDEVVERGCRPAGNSMVFCVFRTTLIGGRETSGFGAVLIVDQSGTITSVRLDLASTEPADLFRYWPDFLTEEATERDVVCAEIGFNSVECGIQESNVLRRYIDYYRQRSNPEDG